MEKAKIMIVSYKIFSKINRVGNMKINSSNVNIPSYNNKRANNYKTNNCSCQPIRQVDNKKDTFVKTSK